MAIFNKKKRNDETEPVHVWARPGMQVTFRAEIMPGKSREQRTFRVEKVRQNGRVVLKDFPDEHREGAFEPINFLRDLVR